jgi:hypothetical protein
MTDSSISVPSESEAVRLATLAFHRCYGTVILVPSVRVECENSDNFREVSRDDGKLIRVKVIRTDVSDQTLFTSDEFLDPVWNVEILDDDLGDDYPKFGYIDGPCFRVSGRAKHVRQGAVAIGNHEQFIKREGDNTVIPQTVDSKVIDERAAAYAAGFAPYSPQELEIRSALLTGCCPIQEVCAIIAAHRRGENIYASLSEPEEAHVQ